MSLTKLEIINILQGLPDLPVVYQMDCDQLMSSTVSKIEVVSAVKGSDYAIYGEYDKVNENEDSEYFIKIYGNDKVIENVIWIS